MLRSFLSALGVLFVALIVFCASFLGNLAVDLQQHAVDYEKLAVDVTRQASRTWKLADIEQHFVQGAKDEAGLPTQKTLDALKPLGVLLYADDVVHKTSWSRVALADIGSPAEAADRLAELLNKSVTVTFVGKFAKGFADVTVELKSEGGRMKLWRLKIDSREQLRPEQEQSRRLISHA